MVSVALKKTRYRVQFCMCIALLLGLSACSTELTGLTPTVAEPKTPAARNITSFGPALQCMDDLLLKAKRPRVRITSTQLPDRTKQVAVGADDMVINALNQMNRRSNAYIFIDQGITKASTGRLLEIEVQDTKAKVQPLQPQFYVRGSISQLDEGVQSTFVDIGLENANEDQKLQDSAGAFRGNRAIVTVDLHLVAFPSRQVLAGASVSNSMVITKRRFGSEFSGNIAQIGVGLLFQIENMESTGQAVRNLIELGLIELLGQHAKVPYWTCLSLDSTNALQSALSERKHVGTDSRAHVMEAQRLLIKMRQLSGRPTGTLDTDTERALAKFQREHGLISNGQPNFDTLRALRAASLRAKNSIKPAPPVSPTAVVDTGGFRSINAYIDGG